MAIVQRIKAICFKPKEEWQVIAGEISTPAGLFKSYVAPLAGIGAVAGFIGLLSVHAPMGTGVAGAVIWFATAIVEVYALALLIDLLAPKFGGEKNRSQALKISAYSFTPALLGGALLLIPSLWLLAVLAALYGVYLLYLGLPPLMKSPPDRVAAYTLAVVACAIGIFLVVSRVTGAIVG